MNAPTTQNTTISGGTVPRTIGLHGRLAVFSAMAGGVAVGGVLVAAMALAGRLSGNAVFSTATALLAVGALLGPVHGAVLGFLGRPAGVTPRQARHDLGRAPRQGICAFCHYQLGGPGFSERMDDAFHREVLKAGG